MKQNLLQLLMVIILGTSWILYSQSKTENTKNGDRESSVLFNKSEYNKIIPLENKLSHENTNFSLSAEPNSVQAWVNITTENFEGTIPSTGWNIYAQSGYTDAYWGKLLLGDNVHYGGWCAASGTQASVWGAGYRDAMRTWMIYGPFDLTDATDASLEFLYFNDCEPTFDSFGWYASLNGSNYNGYFLTDTSTNYQLQTKVFDLKSVPTIGNLTGKNGIYIAFLFNSDSTVSDYNGAIIDEIVLKKFTSSSYPTAISINKSFGFTNVTQSSSYRMIGLPGNINLRLSAPGTQKTDWNAFYDNGAVTDYLVEFVNSDVFNFKPGNGFWLLSKNTINVNVAVNTVPLAGDNTYSIPLHTGWNIISNPFERSTNWSAVQIANGLLTNALLYDWVGSWNNATTFVPYKGYYFNNITGLTSLKIPYDPGGTLGKTSAEKEFKISSENDIKISLLSGGEEKSKIFISFNSASTTDFDGKDFFAPPGDFEDSRIVLKNNNLSTDYKYLMKDSRSEIGKGQIYNLEIKNSTGKELTCNIEGVTKYQDYLAYLVDERLNNEIKISEDMVIKIPSSSTYNNYKFMIGTQQFIEENKGNLTPTSFALYQNYPNPFNPATTIRYSVPKESKVIIKIFDLLGKEISVLDEGLKSPGYHEFKFDASVKDELASGVYVYQMQAGTFTDSKKMILLR